MQTTELIKTFQSEVVTGDKRSPIKTFTVLHYLNKAQETFVKEKFSEAGREEFERTQSVRDDLRSVLSDDASIDASYDEQLSSGIWKDLIALPDDYLHLVNHKYNVQYNLSGISWTINNGEREPDGDYESKVVFGKLYNHDQLYRLLKDPFTTTTYQEPVSSISDKGIVIYTDDKFIIDTAKINYIREPLDIDLNQTSELPEIYHREIINLAVNLFSRKMSTQDSKEQSR